MSQELGPSESPQATSAHDDAVAVISAYGAFRLVLILMAIWSFVEGCALLFGLGGALTLGGSGRHQRVAEEIIGAQMIVFVPVYGLLAWRRDRYRSLMWIPYASQLAMILPLGISLLRFQNVGVLLLVVSLVFLSLLVYFWWQSRPFESFRKSADVALAPTSESPSDGEDEQQSPPGSSNDVSTRRRYRRQ